MRGNALVYIAVGIGAYFLYQEYKKNQVKRQVADLLNPPLVLRSSGVKTASVPAAGKAVSYAGPKFDWTKPA